MFLIAAQIRDGSNPDQVGKGWCDKTYYGLNAAWGCMHARSQFSKLFGFVDGVSPDKRTQLWLTENVDAGYTIDNNDLKSWENNGYSSIKFTNVNCNADGTMPLWKDPTTGILRAGVQPVNAQEQWPNTDYPIIRLADVYLMAAESALRGAAGADNATALKYVNYIRERAGVTPWNLAELTLDNILNERARELYQEATRRSDLIRFGRFAGSNYLWTLKGGIDAGTSIPEYRNLYPLPTNVIAGYGSSMEQNPGY